VGRNHLEMAYSINMRRLHRPAPVGFTLIELLVVVAIIALLISILLPSLSKARSQARTTLCGTRIAQLSKGLLLYADDFKESPPFVDHGFDRPDPNEAWLAEPNQMQIVLDHTLDEDGWVNAGVRLPQSGVLFPYTRFGDLYRCPEFERIHDAGIMQHRFNYTRSIACKKWRPPPFLGGDGSTPFFGDFRGPTMRLGAIFSPSSLIMLIDEQWNRHVAGDYTYNSDPGEDWPMRADCVFFMYDEIGQYHGQPVKEQPDYSGLYKRGSLAYFDGHVELHRDPQPTSAANPHGRPINPFNLADARPFLTYLFNQLYAQQGRDIDISQLFP